MSHRLALGPAFTLVFAACAALDPMAADPPRVATLDGRELAPLAVPAGRIRVLFFVVPDCPIANSYAPAIEALWQRCRGGEVECLLVQCDPEGDAAAARRHAVEYGLTLPVVLDPEQQLAAALGITITPEVAVLTADGLRYRGRIDDRWRGYGKDSQLAEHEDLRLALAALQAGRPVPMPRTRAVGCRLPSLRR